MDFDDSISIMGAKLVLALFIAIVVYFLLSTPIDVIFDAFDDIDNDASNAKYDQFLPYYKTGLNIAFALIITYPVVWFISKVMSREPTFERYRRY